MENSEIYTYFPEEKEDAVTTTDGSLEVCPVCEDLTVVVQGRCKTCYECFWSSCSI